jgi:hypothetical protein
MATRRAISAALHLVPFAVRGMARVAGAARSASHVLRDFADVFEAYEQGCIRCGNLHLGRFSVCAACEGAA